jgi:hypothetical protein
VGCRRDGLPPDLLRALRVLVMSAFELYLFPTHALPPAPLPSAPSATAAVAAPASGADPLRFISARNELQMYQTLSDLIQARLQK